MTRKQAIGALKKMGYAITEGDSLVRLNEKDSFEEETHLCEFGFTDDSFTHCCGAMELGDFYISNESEVTKKVPAKVLDLYLQCMLLDYSASPTARKKKGYKYYPTSSKVTFVTNGRGVSALIERAMKGIPEYFTPVSQWFNGPKGNFLTLWVAVY